MAEKSDNQGETVTARRSIISLRIGYIVSLTAIAVICTFFYNQQSERYGTIEKVGLLSRNLAQLDRDLGLIADHSDRSARSYAGYKNRVDPRFANATVAERKKIRTRLKLDPDIISSIASMHSSLQKSREQVARLRKEWEYVPKHLAQDIQLRSRYLIDADLFSHHMKMLAAERLSSVRTKKDMHWAGREISELYHGMIKPSNLYLQERFHEYLAQLSLVQSELLQRYLLATMGILLLLGLGVFVPIDIIIRRMIDQLYEKRRQIDLALSKAKAADQAKSEFLATMSHEIRTPMNGVLGMAELLTRTDLDTRQRTFTDVILKSGNALLEIINDILDFSKIDAGQMVLCSKPFSLVDTTEDVATLMSSRVLEKDIELIVRIAPGLPEQLVGDPGRIRQVLTNLVGNAVKFTDQGHVMVEVDWKDIKAGSKNARTPRRLSVSISVRDTGIGIPADKIEAVFDKFSQVDGSSTRKHEGTGLGLAIATRLVQLMGGRIELESTPGKGSVFSFTVEMEAHGGKSQSEPSPAENLPGRRVLVVDDNATNRMILAEQMRDWGFDCVAVESGEVGLDLLRHARSNLGIGIDLLVLDFQMPDMTGAEVAEKIRSEPLIADTPILVLSSIDQADQLEMLENLGIFAQLTKPVRSVQLRQTVQAALRHYAKSGRVPDVSTTAPVEPTGPALVDTVSVKPALPGPVLVEVQQQALTQPQFSSKLSRPVEPLVLVAEDNQVNQIVFQQSLDSLGFVHALAKNGREAVAMWADQRPTLVLMDLSMPELNGLEAAAEIRAIEAREQLSPTPIIAVTAHTLKEDEARCLAAGMNDYLSKPISPEKLGAMIERWLPGARSDGEVA